MAASPRSRLSQGQWAPGVWTLAARLLSVVPTGSWQDMALIPIMQILVADNGEVSYAVYEGALSVRPAS